MSDVEAAINETEQRARQFLFDEKGKRLPEDYFITLFMAQTVMRPATSEEVMHPRPGHTLFDRGKTSYVYDPVWGEVLLADAKVEASCDRNLCKAAGIMLDATGRIDDSRLRSYACGRLVTGMPVIGKPKRGRSSKDTWGRDQVIVGRLIRPLLDRFNATRNRETKHRKRLLDSSTSPSSGWHSSG